MNDRIYDYCRDWKNAMIFLDNKSYSGVLRVLNSYRVDYRLFEEDRNILGGFISDLEEKLFDYMHGGRR